MVGHFKKSASILTNQETQMVRNDWWPATICNTEDEDEIFLLQLSPDESCKYRANINGTEVKLLIDSGSSANILDEDTYNNLKPLPSLNSSSTYIYPYNAKAPLHILGIFNAYVKAHDKQTSATFFVIKGKRGSLIGQNTVTAINLLCIGPPQEFVNHLSSVSASTQIILDKHKSTFQGVGKLKNIQLKLHIDQAKVSLQQPIRHLPFHTRKKVSGKIKLLQKLDIIEPTSGPTTWVSPVVPIPKANGTIRWCLNMPQPNEAIIWEKHQIPKLEEILPLLADAKVFSKIDLNEGYHQTEIHPDCRDITTFITHDGTFRYKRLIYSISSAFKMYRICYSRLSRYNQYFRQYIYIW